MMYAGKEVTKAEVRATLNTLKLFRNFLASDPAKYTACIDPYAGVGWDGRWPGMTRGEASTKLKWLIDMAINRKAGIPDVACRKQTYEWQKDMAYDCRAVRDHLNYRRALHSFNTKEMRKRYSHLITDWNEL